MKNTVKNLSETSVQVTITVDAPELEAAKQVALSRLSKKVKAPGFREGKAPVSVVEKHVDQQELQEQILDTAISRAVAEVFVAENIQAIERPSVEVVKYVPGESLEFKADADVLPAVKLGDYKKLKAKLEKAKVEDKDVDEVLERMRQGFAEKKEVARKAKDGDETLIDFLGKKDGEPFDGGAAEDFTLKLGSNQFIPGFEEGLVGHKAGEDVQLELAFPEDYHAESLAGQKVTFEVKLKKVLESALPELDDELAKKAGQFETLDELKADITREIKANKEREATEKLKDALIDEAVAASTVVAPEKLIEAQMKSIEQDFAQNLMYQGLSLENYVKANGFESEDDWRAKEVKPAAERRIKSSMILNELSKVEKIDATDEEVDARVAQYTQQYANNEEALKQLKTEEVRRDIANGVVMDKTINRLVELNTK